MNTENHTRVPLLAAAGLVAATLLAGFHFNARAAVPVSAEVRVSQTAVMKGQDGRVQLELVLEGQKYLDFGERRATDFLVILDRSGSMEGDKIEHGRTAIRELVARLGDDDRFGLVTYSDHATLVYPLERATPDSKSRWVQTASSLSASGNTNMSHGLDLALDATSDASDRAVRVILISDGLANAGDPSPEGLGQRAARFGQRGQALTTIGVGLEFNEYLMSALADAGTGNYYFLERTGELAEVFARELSAGQETIANRVMVTLRPGSGVEVLEAAGYPIERDGATVSFQPGALFAGQKRHIWVTYRVPSEAKGDYRLGAINVSYEADGARRSVDIDETATVACVDDEGRFFDSVDKEAYKDSVLNESYGRLKQSVARAVREGDIEEAKQKIETYRAQQELMNRGLRIGELANNLGDVEKLESEVSQAFTGADQAEKQNVFSKSNLAEAQSMRRVGSKKN